jgi:hypothetical protein
MATTRQTEANQKNAQFSTGPTSPDGRSAASRNSYSHGMTATKVISPEDEARIEQWLIDARDDLRFEGAHQEWLARQVATAAIRISRCQREEDDWRKEWAERAVTHWDDYRREEAAELARRLPKNPELIALKLRKTPQGIDWTLGAWRVLEAVLRGPDGTAPDARKPLDAAQRERAWDLLGLRPEQRLVRTVLDLPEGAGAGAAVSDAALAAHQAAVVAAEIAGLEEHLARTIPLDERARQAALEGRQWGVPPELRLIRRYQATAQRDYQRWMAELRRVQAEAKQARHDASMRDILSRMNRRIDDDPAYAPPTVAAASTETQPSTTTATTTEPIATAVAEPIAAPAPRPGLDIFADAIPLRGAGLRPGAVKAASVTAAAAPRRRE